VVKVEKNSNIFPIINEQLKKDITTSSTTIKITSKMLSEANEGTEKK
jgi:hypothetical protein